MGAPNPNPLRRYENLQLKESLSRPYQYTLACKELSLILRNAYSKLPKYLQSNIFQDTIFAFTRLPEIQLQSAISAANSLLQSAEFALPKQKRTLAVKGYKDAVVASKRKDKNQQEEEGLNLLPQDVLVHMFSFLDLHSLVSAAAVCRLWNAAARDNHLWQLLHADFFHNFGISIKHDGINSSGKIRNKEDITHGEDFSSGVGIDWRHAFKRDYIEVFSKKFKSSRGYCSSCGSFVWLSSINCSDNPCITDGNNHQIKPLSTQQIMDYILKGSLLSESSSDSDSDTDDGSIFKLWAYPRQVNNNLF